MSDIIWSGVLAGFQGWCEVKACGAKTTDPANERPVESGWLPRDAHQSHASHTTSAWNSTALCGVVVFDVVKGKGRGLPTDMKMKGGCTVTYELRVYMCLYL